MGYKGPQKWVSHPQIRLPRRIFHQLHRKERPQDLSLEPRAFQVETLPSTPQLNAIMDRAMGKVKSMVKELEDEKGRIFVLYSHFTGKKE